MNTKNNDIAVSSAGGFLDTQFSLVRGSYVAVQTNFLWTHLECFDPRKVPV